MKLFAINYVKPSRRSFPNPPLQQSVLCMSMKIRAYYPSPQSSGCPRCDCSHSGGGGGSMLVAKMNIYTASLDLAQEKVV